VSLTFTSRRPSLRDGARLNGQRYVLNETLDTRLIARRQQHRLVDAEAAVP
jgi:hypothetical protein